MSAFAALFADWAVETVQVRPYQGDGAEGPSLGASTPVSGVMVRWGDRLVRSSTTDSRMSDVQLAADVEKADLFEPGGEVTLSTGEVRTVLARLIDRNVLPHVQAVLV